MMLLDNALALAKTNQARVAALAAVAGLVGACLLFRKTSGKDKDLAPALTEEMVLEIMTEIMAKLKFTGSKMCDAKDEIKEQLRGHNQDADDRDIFKHYILPHFEASFDELQSKIFATYDVEETEVEDAVNYYIKAGNRELKKISDDIRLMYVGFGGALEAAAPSAPSGACLSEQELLMMLEVISEEASKAVDEFIENFINTNGNPNTPEMMEALQMGLMRTSQEAETLSYAKTGVSVEMFHLSLEAHSNSQIVKSALNRMQMENLARLASYGIERQS